MSVWVSQRADTKKLVGPITLKCKRKRELEWARRAFRLQHERTESRRKDGNRTADGGAVLSMSRAAYGQPWHKDGPRRVLHGIEVARLWCPSMFRICLGAVQEGWGWAGALQQIPKAIGQMHCYLIRFPSLSALY